MMYAPEELERMRDELAVDEFAKAMKVKLARCRAAGRHGWLNMPQNDHIIGLRCQVDQLEPDMVDVANFAMMAWASEQSMKSSLCIVHGWIMKDDAHTLNREMFSEGSISENIKTGEST